MLSDSLLRAVRFILITFALAGAYLLLTHFWLEAANLVQFGQTGREPTAVEAIANDVAARSAAAEARLPQDWRQNVFLLGLRTGYVAQYLGSRSLEDPAGRARAIARMAKHVAAAQELAAQMGVGPAAWPEVNNLEEFVRLQSRFEGDETGLARRIEVTLSPRHRELYLTGVHAGINDAVVVTTGGGIFNSSSATLLARHATLAGLPAAAWQDLVRAPDGPTPEAKTARYQAALAALNKSILGAKR